ncbi:bifunctional 3'-5' exonuclease/DNA polymerase [Herbiconiux moechotypicola]|uniref:DNA-directed DNA polymerase n=1 Tax=Herbiconiux moechotypicola TaxID=637393 RepID=A0ABN3DSM9_9MICO|nr:bifunctional 3'-5' exonuclease/DNA polymerase [Herbiconiux moechotypicola]MCS5731458.1 bifunctional 3'-5' exonuclease/DNA polymerase [Herbiconiux moechotypicola]
MHDTPTHVIVADAGGDGVELVPTAADGALLAWPAGGERMIVARTDLAPLIGRLEHELSHPRWVWDDTARWYPALLAAGVRVERCVDLRLCHAILRASELTAQTPFARAPASDWDTTPPVAPADPTPHAARPRDAAPALFDLHTIAAQPAATPGDDSDPLPGASTASAHPTSAGPQAAPHPTPAGPRPHPATPGPRSADPRPAPVGPHPTDSHPHPASREAIELAAQRTALLASADPSRLALLLAAESAGALAAAEMQHVGLPWSAAYHERILEQILGPRPEAPGARPAQLDALLTRIRDALGDSTANPDSPVELVKSLRRAGLDVSSTRSWELQTIDHPAIPPLLDYKKRARLLTANGWNWLDTWVTEGRFHPRYLPGGVVTGRWASEGGGALQLPKQVRGAVRADPGRMLVVADAAQLEPRILAALSGDEAMAAAGRGRDLYDGIVASGAVDTRAHAKVGMLGAMYGGTTGESGRILPRLARAYPAALRFVENAARAGEAGALVSTRLGRTSPRPSDSWLDLRDAASADGAGEGVRARARESSRSWGRFTRNFVVQGTAAEWALCWIGSIRRRLWALGGDDGDPDARLEERPHLAFFLHDEVMVHAPAALADAVAHEVREAAAEAGRLIFGAAPVEFPVTVAVVESYDRAK